MERAKKVIGFIVFLFLAFRLFSGITYLFRNTDINRFNLTGIKAENDLDMVYVGGSAAFVYWECMTAWNDCGFTSYSLATNTVQAENIRAYIEYAEMYHDPNLYVIDVRAFQYYHDQDDEMEAGIRNGADSMNVLNPVRYSLLNDYFRDRILPDDADIASYYFDIAKYHTNYINLGMPEAWSFIDNVEECRFNGWEWTDAYELLEEPTGFYTEERAVLSPNDELLLNELLDYCDSLDKDFLFVVCPYYISQEDQEMYNTIGDIITSRGYRFFNANLYYDEIGIDFSTDYYNMNHVSSFGAEKYTRFLEDYICENYDMPDHRSDPSYNSWNDEAYEFFQEDMTHRAFIDLIRSDYLNWLAQQQET